MTTFAHPPHRPVWYYIFEATYSILQGAAAKIQAVRIVRNLPISHFWWSVAMVVAALLCVIAYKHITKCRWREAGKLFISLMLVRFISFTPLLNKFRHLNIFYLGQRSWFDRVLAHSYPDVWGLAIGLLLTLQLF